MGGKKAKRESLWYCFSCQMSGAAQNKLGARDGLIMHTVSDQHHKTLLAMETLELHRRLAERKKIERRNRRRNK